MCDGENMWDHTLQGWNIFSILEKAVIKGTGISITVKATLNRPGPTHWLLGKVNG